MKGIVIGQVKFDTKKAAVEFIRDFISKQPLETPLSVVSTIFVANLLEKHCHCAEKIGEGIHYFFVRVNEFHGRKNRGFWIKRIDGSEIDFSWVECLNPSTHKSRVLNALRAAVHADVYAVKERASAAGAGLIKCELSGEVLCTNQIDVHHATPFIELASQFVGESWDSIQVDCGKEAGQIGDRLVCDDLKSRWIDFHNRNAVLQLVSRKVHQSLGK